MLKLIMEKVDHMAKPIKLFQERHGKYNKESNGNQRNEKFSDRKQIPSTDSSVD